MSADPIESVLRHVVETKELLERVVTSSESFDYPKAKSGLRQLQRKIKELGRLQGRLQKMKAAPDTKICVVDFQSSTAANE